MANKTGSFRGYSDTFPVASPEFIEFGREKSLPNVASNLVAPFPGLSASSTVAALTLGHKVLMSWNLISVIVRLAGIAPWEQNEPQCPLSFHVKHTASLQRLARKLARRCRKSQMLGTSSLAATKSLGTLERLRCLGPGCRLRRQSLQLYVNKLDPNIELLEVSGPRPKHAHSFRERQMIALAFLRESSADCFT